jgi:hypothetical protein
VAGEDIDIERRRERKKRDKIEKQRSGWGRRNALGRRAMTIETSTEPLARRLQSNFQEM